VVGCGGTAAPTGAPPTPSRWIRIPTAGLVPGEPRWVTFDSSPGASAAPVLAGPDATAGATSSAVAGAWLVLQADGSVVAFMPGCTHQRCLYDWDLATTRFHCRCHRGSFAADGTVIEGPPPRPLDRYPVRREGPDSIDIGWLDRG
jgi:Rieske Fe-S protein